LAGQLTWSVREHFPSNKFFMKVKRCCRVLPGAFYQPALFELGVLGGAEDDADKYGHIHGAGKR
jgi:hypothetical protein